MKIPESIIIRFVQNGKKVTAIDEGELIRCKECRYWGQDGYREGCKYVMCGMTENDYCSNAEPKVEP